MKRALLLLAAVVLALPGASMARTQPGVRIAQTPPPASQPAPQTPTQPAPKLTGAEAWKELVGNTATGKIDGKEFADYYLPDGTVKSMLEAQTVVGKWDLDGDKVCFTYPDEPRECYTVEVTGDAVVFTDKTGTAVVRAQLQKGNARNL